MNFHNNHNKQSSSLSNSLILQNSLHFSKLQNSQNLHKSTKKQKTFTTVKIMKFTTVSKWPNKIHFHKIRNIHKFVKIQIIN